MQNQVDNRNDRQAQRAHFGNLNNQGAPADPNGDPLNQNLNAAPSQNEHFSKSKS